MNHVNTIFINYKALQIRTAMFFFCPFNAALGHSCLYLLMSNCPFFVFHYSYPPSPYCLCWVVIHGSASLLPLSSVSRWLGTPSLCPLFNPPLLPAVLQPRPPVDVLWFPCCYTSLSLSNLLNLSLPPPLASLFPAGVHTSQSLRPSCRPARLGAWVPCSLGSSRWERFPL